MREVAMDTVIEKRVFLTGERARELEALAQASGEIESALGR